MLINGGKFQLFTFIEPRCFFNIYIYIFTYLGPLAMSGLSKIIAKYKIFNNEFQPMILKES